MSKAAELHIQKLVYDGAMDGALQEFGTLHEQEQWDEFQVYDAGERKHYLVELKVTEIWND